MTKLSSHLNVMSGTRLFKITKGIVRRNDLYSQSTTCKTKVIRTKWAFAIERNESGDIDRFKARLVALGYRQNYGVACMDGYFPVEISIQFECFGGVLTKGDVYPSV